MTALTPNDYLQKILTARVYDVAKETSLDLAKNLFNTEHELPGSSPFILEGYGPIDHPDPQGALWFYTLHHRLVMWWWLRHVGIIPDGQPHDLIDALTQMADEAEV